MRKILIILFCIVMSGGCASISDEAIIDKNLNVKLDDGVSRGEALSIAQKCLIESEYQKRYSASKYKISYDRGEFPDTNLWKYGRSAWMISFKSRDSVDDCMYGAVIFEDGKEQHCQCMNGM